MTSGAVAYDGKVAFDGDVELNHRGAGVMEGEAALMELVLLYTSISPCASSRQRPRQTEATCRASAAASTATASGMNLHLNVPHVLLTGMSLSDAHMQLLARSQSLAAAQEPPHCCSDVELEGSVIPPPCSEEGVEICVSLSNLFSP